ncbi:MAG: LysR family transcriptional regulator [Syntrophorhabdales bacterium]|jgi:DNA-binding transcriptional LysR family regulator
MRPPQINLQHIISFYFVAREKSFSAASERLCITEPAVHQQIRALELQFGVRLVYVKRRRACLTKGGEELLTYAEEFFNQAMMTENFLRSYKLSNLHIGVAATLVLYLMGIMDEFKRLNPAVQITIRQGPSLILAQELADFKHDICLVGTLYTVDKRLRVFRIPEVESMAFVASPAHPLASGSPVKWEDLARHPLVMQPEGSTGRQIVSQRFQDRGLKPLIGAEVDNIEWAKELTRQNLGIALMFLPNVREEVARGSLKIVPVTDGEIKLGIDILMNRETALSPAVEAFLQVIRGHFSYDCK